MISDDFMNVKLSDKTAQSVCAFIITPYTDRCQPSVRIHFFQTKKARQKRTSYQVDDLPACLFQKSRTIINRKQKIILCLPHKDGMNELAGFSKPSISMPFIC